MKKMLLVIILVAFGLVGCSSTVKREESNSTGRVVLSEQNQISSMSISLTNDAKEKLKDNLKFDQNQLLYNVKKAFEANSLLNDKSETSLSDLEIQVKDVRVRSNFSAVMWGFMAGADSITGDIVLRSPSGEEVNRFEVSVSYALGGIAGGQDDARMNWLYEKFAEETINELTGKEKKI